MENHIIVPYLTEDLCHEFIGKGEIGTCYKTIDNMVFKKYDNDIVNYDDLKRQTGLESEFIEFPYKLVYLEEYGRDNLLGLIMKNFIEDQHLII